jgi:hypothetical protein
MTTNFYHDANGHQETFLGDRIRLDSHIDSLLKGKCRVVVVVVVVVLVYLMKQLTSDTSPYRNATALHLEAYRNEWTGSQGSNKPI